MARMAILQVIVPEDDPARIGELMERAAQVLKDAGIAIAVRSADTDGAPMTGDVPWRAKLALHQGGRGGQHQISALHGVVVVVDGCRAAARAAAPCARRCDWNRCARREGNGFI